MLTDTMLSTDDTMHFDDHHTVDERLDAPVDEGTIVDAMASTEPTHLPKQAQTQQPPHKRGAALLQTSTTQRATKTPKLTSCDLAIINF